MNELREKIRQIAIDNDAYVLAKSDGIDAILDAVIAALPSASQYDDTQMEGAASAIEDVRDILQAAKENK